MRSLEGRRPVQHAHHHVVWRRPWVAPTLVIHEPHCDRSTARLACGCNWRVMGYGGTVGKDDTVDLSRRLKPRR